MIRAFAAAVLVLAPCAAILASMPPPRFEKVSDHFYFLHLAAEDQNVGAIVTKEGVLLINPPAEPVLINVLDALKRITQSTVRWVVNTDYRKEQAGRNSILIKRGAQLLSGEELHRLAATMPATEPEKSAESKPADNKSGKTTKTEEIRDDAAGLPDITFIRQMRLYPDNVEVRLIALQHKAHTGADVVIFLPVEKVLQTGDLYFPGSYPEIDTGEESAGSALGWIEGMKQVIDSIPLLKPAIPQPRTEASKQSAEEKSLEELVTVIPARGPKSNLKEMKMLLEISQKLGVEIGKVVAAGRTREAIPSMPSLGPFRINANLDSFALQLFDSLSQSKDK